MLSFDVSAIDVVLLVAMLVLFMLFISQKRGHSAAEPRLNMDAQEKPSKKPMKMEKAAEDFAKKQSTEGFQKCVHQFGYLKDMPKNTPIPDECFGCPTVMRCLFPNVQAPQVVRTKLLDSDT